MYNSNSDGLLIDKSHGLFGAVNESAFACFAHKRLCLVHSSSPHLFQIHYVPLQRGDQQILLAGLVTMSDCFDCKSNIMETSLHQGDVERILFTTTYH